MEINLIFIHEHIVQVATAKKMSDKHYLIEGYLEAKKNDNMKLQIYDIYFSIYCKTCGKLLLQTKSYQEFIISSKKTKLYNYFNEKGKIERVYNEDSPHINLISNQDFYPQKFYKFNTTPFYDSSNIYIGTDEEQKDYFHKKFIDLKTENVINKEENKDYKKKMEELVDELKQYRSGIVFKGDIVPSQEAYHIIICSNSILALNNEGWEIKYPQTKEVYENLAAKPMILVGVVGNRNKGKSFILSKLTNFEVKQGFNIKTEGISIGFGEQEDHCVAILDSAGQEVPLLRSQIKPNQKNDEDQNLELNEIKEDNNEQNKILDEDEIFEISLRDKLITEKFLEEFIIHTSDIIILVVGDITLNEQKILTRVKTSLKNNKFLYVIHNLQNLQFKSEVEDYIENTLKKLYGIEIEEMNFQGITGDCHTKYYKEKDENVIHLIYVNDYCSVKDYYNKPAIDFLKKELDVVKTRTKFSVIEKCKEFFMQIQGDFLEEPIKKEDFVKADNKIKINKKNINLKKVFIDEIGKTITNDTETPNYYYYTEKNDLVINVELPGPNPEIRSRIIEEGKLYIFEFQGSKSGNTSDSKEKHILSKNLKDKAPFKFSIYISKEDITILPNDKGKTQFYERSEKNDQGLFTFKYHISSKEGDNEFE